MGAVLLDASVLYSAPVRDTILRLGHPDLGLYQPRWSARILDEFTQALIKKGRMTSTTVEKVLAALARSFPEASVLVPGHIEAGMTNDPKDRHVLAAAVAAQAEILVTFNLRHFRPEDCEPHRVNVMHPDEFLVSVYDSVPDTVLQTVAQQAADLVSPRVSLGDLIGYLEKANVAEFSHRIAREVEALGFESMVEVLREQHYMAQRRRQ